MLGISSTQNEAALLKAVIIIGIGFVAIASRLFSVVRFESVIHEFDPWFNYRATQVAVKDGFYDFWNWFDSKSWYPLGRAVGGTVYPGLMITSGIIHNFLHYFNYPVDIRNICVLLAPFFSSLTAWAAYLLTSEISNSGAGLLSAAFIGIAPGYISRSVAGSYDNEGISIFLLIFTFYLWIKAQKTGSAFWAALAAIFYFYMVAAWGGYVFITNMVPLHVFVLILMGRFNPRLYIAYSTFYAIGTVASMQIPFVGKQPVSTNDHMSALGVFGLLQVIAFVELVRSHVSNKQFQVLLRGFIVFAFVAGFGALVTLTYGGYIAPWTGRFYSLWDTGYAKIHIPIIASVSEHQPTAWPSYFFDLHILILIFPAGVYLCFRELTDEQVFVIIYSVLASYFSGVMVRLMLTLTPVVCVAAAVAVNSVLETYIPLAIDFSKKSEKDSTTTPVVENGTKSHNKKSSDKKSAAAIPEKVKQNVQKRKIFGIDSKLIVTGSFILYLCLFVLHCTWVTSNAYSSPSIVLASRNRDGSQLIIDDFREAYYWLRRNTDEKATVMSWWDYGYQIAGMSNRTTLVDNNTWNNTHIATVGKAMSSSEDVSYPILLKHDVDYVLVIFGGLLGFSGDDINKFLWMVRIAEGVWPDEVKEVNFFTSSGQYRVDEEATPTMKNSLMYKMSYYRYTELFPPGQAQDRVRGARMPQEGPKLDTLEEAFTSENWIVRIFQVKKPDILGRELKAANAFDAGKKRRRRGTSVIRKRHS